MQSGKPADARVDESERELLARIGQLHQRISKNRQQERNDRKEGKARKRAKRDEATSVILHDGSLYKRKAGGRVISRVAPPRAKKSDTLCKYFVQKGTCMRGPRCAYRHDPARVAVCRKFLSGSCVDPQCPLSHVVDQQKMPMCRFFLFGTCDKSAVECPYSHVYVNPNAAVCPEFMEGVCSAGPNCLLQHTLICPSFRLYGWCEAAAQCPLRHVQRFKERAAPEDPAEADADSSSSNDDHLIPQL